MNIEERVLWCDSLYHITLPEIDNDAITLFTKNKQKNEPTVHKSNIGGWQCDVERNENAELDKLFHKLDYIGNEIFYNKFQFMEEIRITKAWLNVNGKYNYNAAHTHPGAVLSGVYYIKTENNPNQGDIHFKRNDKCEFVVIPGNGNTHAHPNWKFSHNHTPMNSEAIIFPSWYLHDVLANNLDEERISFAFNFQQVNNFKDSVHNMNQQIYK